MIGHAFLMVVEVISSSPEVEDVTWQKARWISSSLNMGQEVFRQGTDGVSIGTSSLSKFLLDCDLCKRRLLSAGENSSPLRPTRGGIYSLFTFLYQRVT